MSEDKILPPAYRINIAVEYENKRTKKLETLAFSSLEDAINFLLNTISYENDKSSKKLINSDPEYTLVIYNDREDTYILATIERIILPGIPLDLYLLKEIRSGSGYYSSDENLTKEYLNVISSLYSSIINKNTEDLGKILMKYKEIDNMKYFERYIF